jgi:hypothetical protein
MKLYNFGNIIRYKRGDFIYILPIEWYNNNRQISYIFSSAVIL